MPTLTNQRSEFPKILTPIATTVKKGKKGNQMAIDESFHCLMGTPFSLLTAILQTAQHGLYMDSSWRNKNAFRCPLTMLVTIDQYHHMVPCEPQSRFHLADPSQ